MALNDVFQAAIRFSIAGEKTANVLHFQQTSSDGALPPNEDLAAAIIEDFLPAYQNILSSDVTIQSIAVKRIDPTIGGSVVVDASLAGLDAGDVMPPQCAAVATLYSDLVSGSGRGRIFISGISDTMVTDGRLVNAQAANFVTLLDILKGSIQGGTGATFIAGIWSPRIAQFNQITYHELRSQIHTLRSRRMANP